MTEVTTFSKSPYYSTALNGAIFDGSIKLYFSQYQESSALRIYFHLQKLIKKGLKVPSFPVFIMLYPDPLSFQYPFSKSSDQIVASALYKGCLFVGIKGPVEEGKEDLIIEEIKEIFSQVGYHLRKEDEVCL